MRIMLTYESISTDHKEVVHDGHRGGTSRMNWMVRFAEGQARKLEALDYRSLSAMNVRNKQQFIQKYHQQE